ncbi:TPA: RHS repeat protein [Salmonella enterica subsp. enterica]|uniref:RHS repeat protein n=8 Tax=Salmonella enterica TaxID=28901 RepID=A0A711GAN6_SALET|nr:RHS element core protein [Salmonella enterica]EDD5460289.1 type IV secretion protein Rhs [Salmonella enterica subsp. enterica serovar Enteritidis]EGC5138879.1 RHS repeat protein [Salmonella enterica subsp. enterica]APV79626.1 type IV secretion protein Rhs [Salmonella enterica subsp. enterica serovar Dublin str. ATCC 39184]AXD48612.1 RHS repeat family protein [Salmonella enterica]EAP4223743.1 RHS repeat protein [Salmonella enterica]
MSGKPAARQGDMTQVGGPIVQGSAGVLIGAPTGVACSVCPTGEASPKYGNPVNPLLGAKVLPGETDIALPGPLPFVLSRAYSSYRTKTPAPVGLCGPGWKLPSDLWLQLRGDGLILNDNGGRSVHFEPLAPGEIQYSRSESFWLARGGAASQHNSHPLSVMWGMLPEAVRLCPHIYLATNSPQGPWWVLGWAERVPGADEALPAPLPPYRVLTGVVDGYGRRLTYHRDGAYGGAVTAVTDSTGRRYRLVLTTQAQRAAQAASASSSSLSPAPSSFPSFSSPPSPRSPSSWSETLPVTACGEDSGIRLSAVWLVEDPACPDALPSQPLVRYGYTARGELEAVYDRSGAEVRRFEYDAGQPGRMTAHRYAGRPASRYRYDDAGRVTEQVNPEGLGYAFAYEKNKITVTDSLGRREVLHTEGEGGLKRVVMKASADGSVTRSRYDASGRPEWQTDATGRKTTYSPDVATGKLTAVTGPDGRKTKYSYNDRQQLTTTVYPDGLRSTREYDERGRLTAETSRTGETTRYSYDNPQSELPSGIHDATGSSKTMRWNRYGQMVAFTDCSGYETKYEYDRFGQMTAVHREEGQSIYRSYNRRGQLTAVRDSQGRETRYDYNDAGDLITVTGPDGNRTETQYDGWGKALSTTQGGLTRRMEYDAAGRVTQLTNENGSHSAFTWDTLDRLTQQTGFDGRVQRYGYDLTGKLTQSEDEDLVTHWHYDASDRLTHRTVNGLEAERWQYDEHGWLTELSHLSEEQRVAVYYGYDNKGRLIRERQTVSDPQTNELLWQHETLQGYSEQGLANRFKPDNLPPVEWLTYGSGYLAGMKLGDMPLLEYTRDRLHREVLRRFGSDTLPESYELTTTYTPGGQLHGQHLTLPQLNREYGYDEGGRLVRISGPQQTREYRYSDTGRLTSVHTTSTTLDITLPYATDPAGNRLPDPEFYPDSASTVWADNRITEDMQYLYRYDKYGRLTEKTDRIPEGVVIRMNDERTHRYEYDNQHRLVHYVRTQHGETQAEGRYLYDPLGRRVGKRVWKRERVHWSDTRMELSRRPYVTWYGWEGDRLTTIQTGQSRVQTLYAPGSFTPLVRIETDAAEQAKAQHRSLAEKLSQEGSEDGQAVQLPAALTAMLDRLEGELRRNAVSEESRAWLAGCGLTPEQMAEQLEPEYTPQRKIHLYHCDQRGLPLALVTPDNTVAWRGEYDEWGNLSGEENPEHLELVIRLPGQQYDEESGLYYNRHRYYNPGQGRYITQDPIGLKGGWNLYQYPLNPVTGTDPLGLKVTFKGDEEQQKAMKEAYESVRKTKHGQEMIEKMELSDHDYIFRGPRKGMEHTCYDPSEYTFYIEIDSDHAACQYQGKGKACKLTPTPLSVVIAHEMGHAMGENDDGPGHMNNVKKHENPVRKEMGIPPRMKY